MVKTLSILLLLVAFIAVCYSEESDQLKEKSTLLDKLISQDDSQDRNKRSLYYRNDKRTMEKERRIRNGDLDYYDDYYYDDYYYGDYYYDPLYYGFGYGGFVMPRPLGVGLGRFDRRDKYDHKPKGRPSKHGRGGYYQN